jgi:type II secretory pathway pseudopilin PulG
MNNTEIRNKKKEISSRSQSGLTSYFLHLTSGSRGFTLIETFVAITILTVSVSAPLSLASQSLHAAQYAKDQVVAFNLAQEAIEVVRARRDRNLIDIIKNGSTVSWRDGIPAQEVGGAAKPFTVDTVTGEIKECASVCGLLHFDETTGFYGYDDNTDPSKFTRTVTASVRNTPDQNEMVVVSTVTWRSGVIGGVRQVTLEEEMYQWIPTN